ncbi:ABC transporter permease [Schaalia naturae]|jgi:hypothetical protein|uniref:ABC transporter permease n=1 Tax=Schaalia naturae TaxID=635203 RepID=A0ABW2SKU6_9ACTO
MTTHTTPVPLTDQVTLADAFRAEWVKFRTLPWSRYALLSTVVLGLGMAVLYTASVGEGYKELTAHEQAEFDPTQVALLGATMFAHLVIGVIGALVAAGEYATGMISTSLTVMPRRTRLFTAKAVLTGTVALALGLVIALPAFLLGQFVLTKLRVPHATLEHPHVLRALLGAGLYFALVGLLGLALGFLVRSTTAAVILLIATTLIVPYFLGPFLPAVVRMSWPTVAGTNILVGSTGGLAPWAGLGVMAAEVAAALAAAFTLFRHRDV